jgi:hypothetical protein
MLPASSPLKSMKFIFHTTRAKIPTSKSGSTVTHAPAKEPLQAGGAERPWRRTLRRAKTDGGEEQRDAEFAEGEVRIHGHVPDLPPDASHRGRGSARQSAGHRRGRA